MKYSFLSFHNSPLDGVQSLVRCLQLKRLKLVNLIDLRWATCHQIISAGWFIEVSNSLSFCVCCTYLNFPHNWKKQGIVRFRDQVERDQDEELEQHQCFYYMNNIHWTFSIWHLRTIISWWWTISAYQPQNGNGKSSEGFTMRKVLFHFHFFGAILSFVFVLHCLHEGCCTTDPGYWFHNLSNISTQISFNWFQSEQWFKLQTQYPGSIVPQVMFANISHQMLPLLLVTILAIRSIQCMPYTCI